MRKKGVVLFFLSIIILSGCNRIDLCNKIEKERQGMDYTVVIPEEDRYLYDSDINIGSLPDKNDIVKVTFSTFNDPQDAAGVWLVFYEQIDFEEKTISYWNSRSGRLDGIKKIQEIALSEDDIKGYREAINYECLKTPINYEERLWKIAILYKDGSHYAYNLPNGYKKGYAENDMIKFFFDKIELTEYEKFIVGL